MANGPGSALTTKFPSLALLVLPSISRHAPCSSLIRRENGVGIKEVGSKRQTFLFQNRLEIVYSLHRFFQQAYNLIKR